jgi:hypothetical protein
LRGINFDPERAVHRVSLGGVDVGIEMFGDKDKGNVYSLL